MVFSLLLKILVNIYAVNIVKNVLIMLKKFAADALKTTPKRVIPKTVEAAGDLVGNKIANETTKDFKNFTTEYFRYQIEHQIEYQKIINLLDNMPYQPSKFRAKNLVEIIDDARGTYSTNSQVKFKLTMLKSILCDYSDA